MFIFDGIYSVNICKYCRSYWFLIIVYLYWLLIKIFIIYNKVLFKKIDKIWFFNVLVFCEFNIVGICKDWICLLLWNFS